MNVLKKLVSVNPMSNADSKRGRHIALPKESNQAHRIGGCEIIIQKPKF